MHRPGWRFHLLMGDLIGYWPFGWMRTGEELGECGNFEDDTLEIVDVLKVARRMIEEVIEALTAHFAAQGGAT